METQTVQTQTINTIIGKERTPVPDQARFVLKVTNHLMIARNYAHQSNNELELSELKKVFNELLNFIRNTFSSSEVLNTDIETVANSHFSYLISFSNNDIDANYAGIISILFKGLGEDLSFISCEIIDDHETGMDNEELERISLSNSSELVVRALIKYF